MDLNAWCQEAEELRVKLGEAYWDMRVGLPYSEDTIKELESKNGAHNEVFLKGSVEDRGSVRDGGSAAPRLIFLDAVESVATARTVHQALAFEEARKQRIVSPSHSFNGAPVSWPSWRQWVVTSADRSRKRVFDEFIEKTPLITPLIKERFEKGIGIFEEYDTTPLQVFAEHHHVSIGQLRSIVEQLRDTVRPGFVSGFSEWTNRLFGRDPAYFDDFYFMRNKIYEDLIPAFSHVDSLAHCLKTMRAMGLDPSKVKLDDADRPGKYPSPFCSFIRTPTDIRVSFKAENPLNTAVSVYHEFGHAIHASSIDPALPYWTRNLMSMGLAESFSTFFEDLLEDEEYCVKELKIDPAAASDIRRRIHFHNQFAVAFYCANSLFRIDTYDKRIPFHEWDDLYARHVKDCMGIDMPGEYWQLHHILPESFVYVPSYLLAFIRSREMAKRLQKEFGSAWWRSPAAGKPLRDWMRPGQDSPLADFSRLDVRAFLKYIKETP